MQLNWCPNSFDEFLQKYRAGKVRLGILPEQYTWLYANALPFKLFHYMKHLLKKMASDEALFKKVHDHGIDLILDDD